MNMSKYDFNGNDGHWPESVVNSLKNKTMDEKPEVITVIGQNSGMALEIDIATLALMAAWFVQKAPEEVRTLQNVTKVIHLKDKIELMIIEEMKAGNDYIENRAMDRLAKDLMHDDV